MDFCGLRVGAGKTLYTLCGTLYSQLAIRAFNSLKVTEIPFQTTFVYLAALPQHSALAGAWPVYSYSISCCPITVGNSSIVFCLCTNSLNSVQM